VASDLWNTEARGLLPERTQLKPGAACLFEYPWSQVVAALAGEWYRFSWYSKGAQNALAVIRSINPLIKPACTHSARRTESFQNREQNLGLVDCRRLDSPQGGANAHRPRPYRTRSHV
jgi:hypothetical protein